MSEPVLRGVSPRDLKAMLTDGGELALLDVREELIFSRDTPASKSRWG